MRGVVVWLILCLIYTVNVCSADHNTFQVVGIAQCTDCTHLHPNTFPGLHVTIDCKLKNGDMKRFGSGDLNHHGEFKISIPYQNQILQKDCYAKLHSSCQDHDATRIIFANTENDAAVHKFSPIETLKFSSGLCNSKFKKWLKSPKLSDPWVKKFGHHWSFPPLPPLYKKKPFLPPIPLHKPSIPIENPPQLEKPLPPPVPVVKPPVKKPSPPIYKPKPIPPPVPISKPPKKPCPTVQKPPVIKKPPVQKPPVMKKPPVEKPPVMTKPPVITKPPVYKPPVMTKPPVYKPPVITKPPVYKPPVITKPPIPVHPLFPPFKKKPCPPLLPKLPPFPPKIFHHPKFGSSPPLVPAVSLP